MVSLRQSVKRLLTVRGTPHAIALGTALGLFVGFTPTVGVQMITVVFLGTLIGANRIIAVAMVWISNPLTVVPMYYGYYWVGTVILGTSRWTFEDFADHASALVSLNWFVALKSLGWDVGVPLVVGSLVIASGVASLSYPIVLGLAVRYRRARFRHLTSRRASRRRRADASGAVVMSPSRRAGIAALLGETPEVGTSGDDPGEAGAGGLDVGSVGLGSSRGADRPTAGDETPDDASPDRPVPGSVARRKELPR